MRLVSRPVAVSRGEGDVGFGAVTESPTTQNSIWFSVVGSQCLRYAEGKSKRERDTDSESLSWCSARRLDAA